MSKSEQIASHSCQFASSVDLGPNHSRMGVIVIPEPNVATSFILGNTASQGFILGSWHSHVSSIAGTRETILTEELAPVSSRLN
jgi:hypothetical protein